MSLIQVPRLRTELASRLLVVERAHDRERQDYQAFKEVWEPYLNEFADLLQVWNHATNTPGFEDTVSYPLPLTNVDRDHRDLISRQDFQNAVLTRWGVSRDPLIGYDTIDAVLDRLLATTASELGRKR